MHQRRWGALAAVLAAAVLAVLPAADARAAAKPGALPNVYGPGVPMAFSGFDGKTSAGDPFTAVTLPDGLGMKFDLPRYPVLKIFLPDGRTPQWELVSNDMLVGRFAGDPLPLVVAFSAARTVVGRVPAGARVTLEGGDMNIAIFRGEVGDRTSFAVVHSPQGSRAVALAGAEALKVSLDTLVENRVDFFRKALPQSGELPPPRARTLAKALSVLRVNTVSPEDPVRLHWTMPARWPDAAMVLGPTALGSLGLMHVDVRLAKESLEAAYSFQTSEGMLPQRMGPGQTSEISHPPLVAWAAWQVYAREKTGDRRFLERSFDVAQKHTTWYMRKRRLDGEPPPEKPIEHGTPLYAWASPEEAWQDNSPRFEGGVKPAAIDLSCYLVSECRALQAIAQHLGFRELAKTWSARGDAIAAAARQELWNAERGFFFDRQGPGGAWVDVWSAAGLLPLWAGIATPEQAAKLKEHLLSPKKFRTAAPVPGVARDDPKYKADMAAGPTWAHVNYMIIRGLQRYGFAAEAEDLRQKTLDTITGWYGRTGALYEFYDADGQAPPATLDRKGRLTSGTGLPVLADYNPTAAVYIDLLVRPRP